MPAYSRSSTGTPAFCSSAANIRDCPSNGSASPTSSCTGGNPASALLSIGAQARIAVGGRIDGVRIPAQIVA